MSDPVAPIGAEFLDGLTQVICDARAEYVRDYQDAWLAGKMSMGPDEFLALCAAEYTRKHSAAKEPKVMTAGGGPVKLPMNAITSSDMDQEIKTYWFNNAAILSDYGITLPGNSALVGRLRSNTYNFIGALRKRSTS